VITEICSWLQTFRTSMIQPRRRYWFLAVCINYSAHVCVLEIIKTTVINYLPVTAAGTWLTSLSYRTCRGRWSIWSNVRCIRGGSSSHFRSRNPSAIHGRRNPRPEHPGDGRFLLSYPAFVFSCLFITLPAGAVAKYCDEHVCVCVCLSERISPESQARSFPNF